MDGRKPAYLEFGVAKRISALEQCKWVVRASIPPYFELVQLHWCLGCTTASLPERVCIRGRMRSRTGSLLHVRLIWKSHDLRLNAMH